MTKIPQVRFELAEGAAAELTQEESSRRSAGEN
jgi:hypothetical protein